MVDLFHLPFCDDAMANGVLSSSANKLIDLKHSEIICLLNGKIPVHLNPIRRGKMLSQDLKICCNHWWTPTIFFATITY